MNTQEQWNWRAISDLAPVSKDVQQHLTHVYRTLTLAVASAAVAVYVNMHTFLFTNSLLPFIASLGLLFWLLSIPPLPENASKRESIFYGFAFCNGLYIAPLVTLFYYIDPYIVFQALGGTALIFLAFSLSAIFNRDRSYLLLGGMLMSSLSLLFWVGLVNIFLRSDMVTTFQLYFGLLVMSGFVLVDTQMIIVKASLGYKDHVTNALALFQDLISMFVRLMTIIARNRQGSNENDRRRRQR